MTKYNTVVLSALAAFAACAGTSVRAADTDNMASIAIDTGTEVVTLAPHWAIRPSLSGFHFMAQDMGLTGGAPNQFYSLEGKALPSGDITAFTYYVPGSGYGTDHVDISTKLTLIEPNSSYSGLTSADPDLGTSYGAVRLYTIHHTSVGDWLTVIKTSSATASAVSDPKPMSGPGGTESGYFGLAFSADDLGDGANIFYYFRKDAATHTTWLGSLAPALASPKADKFNLGTTGHSALAYTAAGITTRYGVKQMYFLRLDSITGFTIFGTLNPITGKASDMANLGSVYNTLTYVPGDVGYGTTQFYTTGTINTKWQSISFAAMADGVTGTPFTVHPTASSALPITLTVVAGSTGAALISAPVGGVFTVTPTAPGLITLQATQVGTVAKEYNMLRQSFTATGATLLAITTQPTAQSAVAGTTANFTVTASGTTTLSYQWRKAGINIVGNASALTAALALTNVQAADGANYDVVVTNTSGSITSNTVALAVTNAPPIITNSPLTAAGTVGAAFSFTITASNLPASYTASPLPAGILFDTTTGIFSGTPSAAGTTAVALGATNSGGTGIATLSITVAAAGLAPIIPNAPLTSAGTVGTPYSFTITATNLPTSYTASPLPAGLALDGSIGVITGTPTAVGVTVVSLGATNSTGTGSASLTITVAAAGVTPIISNSPLTVTGTVGIPFGFTITAAGTPTSYSASPLPAGLIVVEATGVISGTPTAAGTTSVLLGATNLTGTGNATLKITIAPAVTLLPGQQVAIGHDVAISAPGATGSLQWQISTDKGVTWVNLVDNKTYSGVNTSTLEIIGGAATMDGNLYRIVVSGTPSTTVTKLTVVPDNLVFPTSVGSDQAGNLYVTDVSTNTIRKITTTGQISLVAGHAGLAGSIDGTGSNATFNEPDAVAVAPDGTLTVSDTVNNLIRSVSTTGTVTTLAGNATGPGASDGAGLGASFRSPMGIARDSNGNFYVADELNQTIRKVTSGGAVTTLAGSPGAGGVADGSGANARFNLPSGVAVDGSGTVYVSDSGSNTIRMITSAGAVTTLAGHPGVKGSLDGTGTAANFNNPGGLAVSSAGDLYLTDTGNSTIRKITKAGVVTTVAGLAGIPGLMDGTGTYAWFDQPEGLTFGIDGNLYVADTGNGVIRKVTLGGVVTTLVVLPDTSPAPAPLPTPAPATGGGGGGGGGGAINGWFALFLGLITLVRRWTRKN